ncbi:MAG: hypothetical protein ACE37B_12525 [Ilumatobacter sp.]|uniref:hypothetical protein n=1 Tax=Ilumatobacter sp. TaxID=1967498 RepID=UPI00391D3156
MPNHDQPRIPDGWVGGFAQSRPEFAYPNPDLGSLDMLKNMDNIHLLTRQQAILWPEFSWETEPGQPDPKRCFQMFAPDISRIGYDDEGRVYAIICPQQGIETPSLGSINVEITVTGTRGWVDEATRELACDMSVEARVWFAPGYEQNPAVMMLWTMLQEFGHELPISKDKAIVVSTHEPGNPDQPIFRVLKGETTRVHTPRFADHSDEAWSVGHIEVQVGTIVPTHDPVLDGFNQLLLEILNTSGGNLLKAGNVLTWNIWVNHPEVVDQEKWRTHAEKWRLSIDVDHVSDARRRSPSRFADGTPFHVADEIVEWEVAQIMAYMRKQWSPQQRVLRKVKSVARAFFRLANPFRR